MLFVDIHLDYFEGIEQTSEVLIIKFSKLWKLVVIFSLDEL